LTIIFDGYRSFSLINNSLKGRSFTLKNASLNKVGAPATKGGVAGAYTKEEGIYSFFEICEKINDENWKKAWDQNQQSAYATFNDQWVGYDNERSIALKVHWALTVMSLGGTMLWTLDFDDYSGQFCGQGEFPLAKAIKAVFDEYETETEVSNRTELRLNEHEFDDGVLAGNKRIESVLTSSVAFKPITTASTTTTTTVTNTTIKTFYLPNIKNLSDFQSLSEKEKLNGVMYEIMNVPLVVNSKKNELRNNLTIATPKTALSLNKTFVNSLNILKCSNGVICFILVFSSFLFDFDFLIF